MQPRPDDFRRSGDIDFVADMDRGVARMVMFGPADIGCVAHRVPHAFDSVENILTQNGGLAIELQAFLLPK